MVQQGRVGRIIGAASGYQRQGVILFFLVFHDQLMCICLLAPIKGDVFTSAYSLTNSAMRGLTQAAGTYLYPDRPNEFAHGFGSR